MDYGGLFVRLSFYIIVGVIATQVYGFGLINKMHEILSTESILIGTLRGKFLNSQDSCSRQMSLTMSHMGLQSANIPRTYLSPLSYSMHPKEPY